MSEKVVVITGGSGGIGAAVAKLLADRGDNAVIVARRRDALEKIAAGCNGRAFPIVADVTKREQVQSVVSKAIERFGHVDVWINNVGQGITRPPSQITDADIDEMMIVNVKTALYGTQEILPHFKSRNSGHVINISSMLGRIPFALFRSAYNGAKHFLNALTANFRTEFHETHPGIQFSLVSPGVVRTEFGKNALHGGPDSRELPYSQSAEEVAAVILKVIDERIPDVYTRAGSQATIAKYFAEVGVDP